MQKNQVDQEIFLAVEKEKKKERKSETHFDMNCFTFLVIIYEGNKTESTVYCFK